MKKTRSIAFVTSFLFSIMMFCNSLCICAQDHFSDSSITEMNSSFSDVPPSNPIYPAIKYLAETGIIRGYEDGRFRPENSLTRAEAATTIVNAGKYPIVEDKSVYSDVSDFHWAKSYIMTATNNGIINGMGNGQFSPDSYVTYNQIIKMVTCLKGLEADALRRGGWPYGYIETAYMAGILKDNDYKKVRSCGDEPATRGDTSTYIYNALYNSDPQTPQPSNSIIVGGNSYTLGSKVSSLGTPDEILTSTFNFVWYVFGTNTYQNFFAAGVSGDTVVVLFSAGKGFSYQNCSFGDMPSANAQNNLYTDQNAGGSVHAVYIANNIYTTANTSEEALKGESKMNFHATNAFRAAHGKKTLKWDSSAEKAAILHSKDMADNDYFSHDSKDGRKFYDRLTEQGITYYSCAENILGGCSYGARCYNEWVNSSGHRKNMLSNQTYLGVGGAYKKNSSYVFYFTQDFYEN